MHAPIVHTAPDPDALAVRAAARVTALVRAALDRRHACDLALAGGSTPARLYARLASHHAADTEWSRVRFWFGDERLVPPDHPNRNERAARAALLTPLRVPEHHVLSVRDDLPPDLAAREYEQRMTNLGLRARGFDLVLLGMGADGHTLSLFPGSPALGEAARLVAHAVAPPSSPVKDRVTLTLPAVADAHAAVFLVTGSDKSDTFRRVLNEARRDPPPADSLPASRVRARTPVEWFIDEAAAGSPPVG
ncbi:MAG: 6-phosphogluconolactonase [Phycisphaeraceae bacterium]|nr:MAG: 6-phosphogluconolactonase [Phycisphaeraceae bacterium]